MSDNFKLNEILEKIRRSDDCLKRINLDKVEVSLSKAEAVFYFVSDREVGSEATDKIVSLLKGEVPPRFTLVSVKFSKLVADEELVKKSVVEYIKRELISISACITEKDVEVVIGEENCLYTISVDDDVYRYMEKNKVEERISKYLSEKFSKEFIGKIKNVGKTEIDGDILVGDGNVDIKVRSVRKLKVSDVVKLWGEEVGNEAIYIADAGEVSGEACFSGKIQAIYEKTSKNGKTYYLIELDDTTGKIIGKAFMTKEKSSKIEKLQVGSEVITRGVLEIFNGLRSYVIKDVSFCAFPKDFKPEEKPSNPVPAEYRLIFPEPVVEYSQAELFKVERPVPECLKEKSFVVVDIETTGIKYYLGDKITEIGAFKIVDGKITESFTTLIDPEMPISEEITKLTGIDGEMVKGKPKFSEVLPDFYKFCYGSVFVAHNIDFDYKFIKYMAKDTGYDFKNEGLDTLALSQKLVKGLKNYKLNTICEHFGIKFLHHRAMSDAYATAKLLIELANIGKSF